MTINIIGVPIMYGCDRKGPELGPDTLRKNGLIETIKATGKKVYDLGDMYIPKIDNEDKFASDPNMKYFSAVSEITTNLAERVSNSLAAKNFPLIIGGDHSLGLGTVSGASRQLKNLAVIWVDAHGDINTAKTSPSKNMHGMPLAALMGEGDKRLVDLYYEGTKVRKKDVILIGCRSLDDGEQELINKEDLTIFSMDFINENSIESVIETMSAKLKKNEIENIHLSLDIDCLDPAFAPGTGTDVTYGMTPTQLKKLISAIIDTGMLRSMGLVELNPLLDDENNKTTKLCLDIIKYVAERIN